MATCTFNDYMVFSGATNVNEDTYSTIAKGVIKSLETLYGIFIYEEEITKTYFLPSQGLLLDPQVYPVSSITSIFYDGSEITEYSYYGEDIELTTTLADYRKPVTVTLQVGFNNIPNDLVLAIYRHISHVFQAIDKHTDTYSKVINTDGNTTYFNSETIPSASAAVYRFYAGSLGVMA